MIITIKSNRTTHGVDIKREIVCRAMRDLTVREQGKLLEFEMFLNSLTDTRFHIDVKEKETDLFEKR
jgi:hypothetical protein